MKTICRLIPPVGEFVVAALALSRAWVAYRDAQWFWLGIFGFVFLIALGAAIAMIVGQCIHHRKEES